MLFEILLVAVVVLALFVGYVAVLPRVATVSRSAEIAAPPDRIFRLINSLENWQLWSPWTQLDSDAEMTFSGPASGLNASLAWSGNHVVGAGTMTIVDGAPNDFIRIRLDFTRPYPSTDFDDFLFQPINGATRVIWTMTSDRPFRARLMALLFRTDAMVGRMFEKGLAGLAEAAGSEEREHLAVKK